MAGYNGYSMSNNAIDAYDNGEMPKSKWTKRAILDGVIAYGIDKHLINLLTKVPAPILKDKLLYKSSWHHTSKMFNRTDFYSLDLNDLDSLTEGVIEQWLTLKPNKEIAEQWECEYLTWGGTRKHPKATVCRAKGIIKGNWFYLPDGTKKSCSANGFRRIRLVAGEV